MIEKISTHNLQDAEDEVPVEFLEGIASQPHCELHY